MRVGLVLGAGGVLGGAWLVAGLHALAEETGWDPADAEYIVGTSAGAMVAGLLASGMPPGFMLGHSLGDADALAVFGDQSGEEARSPGSVYRLHRGRPALGPGSWRLAAASLARPYRYSPATILAGWMPQGLISSDPLKDTIRRVVPEGWAPHPHLWIMACDHDSGRRVAFGSKGAPRADLADAVAASCAIPGFYHPVQIGGHNYVDGGIASTSNLDVLAGLDLDLVICLNPMSSLHAPEYRTLGDRAARLMRGASGRKLGGEARAVRASGTDVVLIQPAVQDLDAMGSNLMSAKRRHHVLEVGVQSVAARLQEPELRRQLGRLRVTRHARAC